MSKASIGGVDVRRWALAGLAICGSLVAGPGCDWGPFDMSPEPVIVTVTDHEFRVGEDYIHGQLAISIENQTRELLWYLDCGNVLDRLGSRGQWQEVWNTFCLLSTVEEVSIGPGEVLERSQFISASIAEDATGWTTPIDGTYRLRVHISNARAVLSTDGWLGVASKPFLVATEHP